MISLFSITSRSSQSNLQREHTNDVPTSHLLQMARTPAVMMAASFAIPQLQPTSQISVETTCTPVCHLVSCHVHFLKLDAGDIWYLRLLLHHVPASSWNDIRTVQGTLSDSHELLIAPRQLGLVQHAEITFWLSKMQSLFPSHENFDSC